MLGDVNQAKKGGKGEKSMSKGTEVWNGVGAHTRTTQRGKEGKGDTEP